MSGDNMEQIVAQPIRGKADLHLHTTASDGMGTVEEVLEYVEHKTDLDVIAITDHDEIRGAWAARELAAKNNYRFKILMGQEITSRHGHILIYGVEEPFKMFKSLEATVEWAHERGGVVIIPHPLSYMTLSVGENQLRKLFNKQLHVDGIEIINPSIAGYVRRHEVKTINDEEWDLAQIGSSDAHFPHHIATAYTSFPGKTIEELLQAIKDRTTQPHGRYLTIKEQLQGAGKQNLRSLVILPADKMRRAIATVSRRLPNNK
ncbi:PHP domain-containing protein [Candidatus Chlorohelix allophototropha]|uniref:PHP domain-containing protein n=2 Tax=Candidatus Chlorohelix allophototropha TaxID=3003348 RepID=A0ABY9B526_9CHLR|nr:PHP domain-containing protein [Chloroflexota bacterium L227-S17]